MDILINLTTQKECVTTAIIAVEGTKNLGGANMKNYMRLGYAKIVTLTTIIARKGFSLDRMRP